MEEENGHVKRLSLRFGGKTSGPLESPVTYYEKMRETTEWEKKQLKVAVANRNSYRGTITRHDRHVKQVGRAVTESLLTRSSFGYSFRTKDGENPEVTFSDGIELKGSENTFHFSNANVSNLSKRFQKSKNAAARESATLPGTDELGIKGSAIVNTIKKERHNYADEDLCFQQKSHYEGKTELEVIYIDKAGIKSGSNLITNKKETNNFASEDQVLQHDSHYGASSGNSNVERETKQQVDCKRRQLRSSLNHRDKAKLFVVIFIVMLLIGWKAKEKIRKLLWKR
uniref:Uncharacterized protein n=1 Tax=Aplanochytrium stocchinoi TaxID=215587 RepID=A0A6S8AYT4_9STRA|mmetsp:Transcript_6063/g.7643  ORF Transcript_6063/g.7643 Transcript_6063/m.7643 type:complete len:284 (+) Transcript_6063:247-1098(+)